MEFWQIEIKKFDRDLDVRMALIRRFECCQYSIAVEARKIKEALGYISRSKFGRPIIFDYSLQWKRRNSERHNENLRRERAKNPETYNAISRRYYYRHHEEEKARNRAKYYRLTDEEKKKRLDRQKELRKIKKDLTSL